MSDPAPPLVLDHVQVAAPRGSEAAARHFYGVLLGLEEVPKPPPLAGRGGAWFRCGPHQIHVGIEDDFRPSRKAHVALRLADAASLESLAARLSAAGVAIRRVAALESEGMRRFYADDPWGNRLEFLAPG
jgi:catechol 2,3-dioxygenase-like lactoylglutathione lyase family enzyme